MMLRSFKLPRPLLIFLRVSVGLIFVAMGSWKIGANEYGMGGRIGELFTFLETTGLWWDLVGWTQVTAGFLLITQRFATIAAMVLFGVTLNIAAVNIAFWPEFATTMVLTAYALLSLTLLLLHDIDRWKYLFWNNPPVLIGELPNDRCTPFDETVAGGSSGSLANDNDPVPAEHVSRQS